eukprot:SAG25_NODE_2814_length_1373_cov_1.153061_2_plen_154_part_00
MQEWRRSGQTAWRTTRRNQEKKLKAESEQVAVQRAQLEAERVAFAGQQGEEGRVLDLVTQVRAATAAIADGAARKRHGQLVANAEEFLQRLVAAPSAGAHVPHRLTTAAAGLVCSTALFTPAHLAHSLLGHCKPSAPRPLEELRAASKGVRRS